MSSQKKIHRRVDAPVEFNGLKGPYILFAGGVIIGCLFLFAILYIAGLNSWICLALCAGIGAMGVGGAWYCSHHYGVHGRRKRRLARRTPKHLRTESPHLFTDFKN